MMSVTSPSIEAVRSRFPALDKGFAFMDNAGGSQVPREVADAMRDYMLSSYVQIGADYPASRRATANIAEAHGFVEILMGGDDAGRVILGSSTSTLLRMLADAYAQVWELGSEIVVAENGHEANVSPWLYLGDRGFTIRVWEADPETGVCSLDKLKELLSSKTRLVSFPQVSNILGGIEDFGLCIEAAHAAGARVVLDGVAYAPHLPMKVAEWGPDWYVFSCYKVFGPHMAALWGTHEAQAELCGPNHSLIPRASIPYKFELGGVSHEGCAGLNAIRPYLQFLAGDSSFGRQTAVRAMEAVDTMERPLTARFLSFLQSKPRVRILGPVTNRLPILSFVHGTVPSKAIADGAEKHGIGIRWGNFYSYRLLERMGIDPAAGVARASFAHYNSMDEVERLIEVLDSLLN